MPRKIKEYGRQDLIDVALPNHASTYTVISHKSVMDLSTKALEDAGFKITAENYRATHDGNIASAIYTLNYGDDSELSMMFAWSNSYNKQMRFKCGIGAIHTTNRTTMVCGDMGSWARKHIGTADTETEDTIKEQVSLAKMYYDQLVSDKERMKQITLDRKKQAQLLGILFADQEILTTEQASLIRQQMSRPLHQFADNNSLWAFYNYVTLALQQSHPKTWMEDQRVLHWFISEAFKFDKVENEEVNKGTETLLPSDSHSEEESVDPAQVDLEDSIAEIEAENAADAEMQEMKTEQIIEEREEEDNTPIVKAKDTKPFPTEDDAPVYDEDQIAERIREDEAAVAEVCDEQEVTYEEAQEYVAAQMAVDKLDAEEEGKRFVSDENIDATVKSEDADFSLEFSVDDEDDDDVQSGDMDFGFA
jgi:hypothetical protein